MLIIIKPDIQAQDSYLLFGKGGGISGETTAYKILKSGKVLKGSGRADITFSKTARISKSDAKILFNEVKDIPDSSFSYPGNIYYFIFIKDKNKENKFTWGASEFEVTSQIRSVYLKTMFIIGNLNYKDLKKHS